MTKCPPMPHLVYVREPCHRCGAVDMDEAETKCKPMSDETGEYWCGAEFDDEGHARAPTAESIAAQTTWYGIHYDCFPDCVAEKSAITTG